MSLSLFLWGVAPLMLMLGVVVALGYARLAPGLPSRPADLLAMAVAALALGSGLWSCAVLMVTSQALPFELGFAALPLAGLWLLAVVGALVALALMRWRPRLWMALVASVLFGGAVLALQMGMALAVGSNPGLAWGWRTLGLAAVVLVGGFSVGWWLAFAFSGESGDRRLWRSLAALVFGLAGMLGHELVLMASGLAYQNSSAFLDEVPAVAASLAAAVAWPLVGAFLYFDLRLRGEPSGPAGPTPRRKRRYRIRRLY